MYKCDFINGAVTNLQQDVKLTKKQHCSRTNLYFLFLKKISYVYVVFCWHALLLSYDKQL
jgi:hypothetical protein